MKLPQAIAQTRALPPDTLRSILRVVSLYAFFAAAWILLSDRVLGWLFEDIDSLRAAGTLKGLLFVAVTSVLLFFLVLRLAWRQHGGGAAGDAAGAPAQSTRRGLPGSVVLFSLVFLALAGGGMVQNWQQHRAHQGAFLRSVAELKASQIEEWLAERSRDAEAVRSALLFGEAGGAWRKGGDARARQKLLARLEAYRSAMRYGSVAIADARGEILLVAGAPMHDVERELQATVQQALAGNRIAMTDLFRVEQPGHEHVHFDIVVPLSPAPEAAAEPVAIVLRIDVEASLYPFLQSWPTPSASAEIMLFRQEGDSILFLNELRHEKNTALNKRRPLSAQSVLGVQALAPGLRPGTLLEGVDYRDVPALGVVRPIAGTSWWLVAKVDRDESFSGARKESMWIGFSGLLTWFAAMMLGLLYFQRRELLHAQAQRREQADKLQALQLLEAIANGSTDAIYAKDTAGRYLLFNKEAARLTGKTPEQVLGRDDTALFPAEQAARLAADDRAAMSAEATATFLETLDTADGKAVFLATKGPLRNADGQVFGLFGVSRDITKLAQTETALRKERDLNQRYLDTVQTLMVALDDSGRVTMVNRFGCDLLGYAESELLGHNWFEIALPQPDGLERGLPMFLRIIAGDVQAAEYFENTVRCRDGRERLLAWHNAVLTDDAGRIVGILSSGEDISDRRQAEDARRRQADELAARNAELERFNRAMVGRELDMIALKRRINELSFELGREPPHDLAQLDSSTGGGPE
ncbi:MAG: PAS domain S-box protein [Rhodocyclales bacterium]|nr:PAS domain S-box protein [Rhodocyclales bacterium]